MREYLPKELEKWQNKWIIGKIHKIFSRSGVIGIEFLSVPDEELDEKHFCTHADLSDEIMTFSSGKVPESVLKMKEQAEAERGLDNRLRNLLLLHAALNS